MTPLWLWPNLLSLDAPLIAVLWQGLLAYQFSIPLRPAARIVLGLTVWAIYLFDRLLDTRQPASGSEPARHRFYRRHRRSMAALLLVALVADALIAVFGLRPQILHLGMVPLAGVLLYLATVHTLGNRFQIPKEVAASALFTAGTFLPAWATPPSFQLGWAAAAFFVLCLANLIAIETWEKDAWEDPSPSSNRVTRWLASTYLFWVPVAVILCAIFGRNKWYVSVAASAAATAVLFWLDRRISLDARRVLADGVLLTPLVFLMLK
jgi:hypothetical protein